MLRSFVPLGELIFELYGISCRIANQAKLESVEEVARIVEALHKLPHQVEKQRLSDPEQNRDRNGDREIALPTQQGDCEVNRRQEYVGHDQIDGADVKHNSVMHLHLAHPKVLRAALLTKRASHSPALLLDRLRRVLFHRVVK